jgi:teichoic acid transport system ATP-binding protein
VLVDPDILIVDEVLAVGDTNFQKKCLETIKSFKKRGKAIIFVSHSMEEIKNFCDTALFLKEGKVGKIGPPAEAVAAYMDYLATHPQINPKENLSSRV